MKAAKVLECIKLKVYRFTIWSFFTIYIKFKVDGLNIIRIKYSKTFINTYNKFVINKYFMTTLLFISLAPNITKIKTKKSVFFDFIYVITPNKIIHTFKKYVPIFSLTDNIFITIHKLPINKNNLVKLEFIVISLEYASKNLICNKKTPKK